MENSITLDMDETRELKWTFGAIKNFEKRGREILKRMDIKNERGQAIATSPMSAGIILANFLRIAEILEAAIAASTGLPGLEGKKGEPSEAAQAIDGYIERGGNIEDLQNLVYKAYLLASDPSSIATREENIAREAEAKRINREKAEAKMEIARLELDDDRAKIAKLRETSGEKPIN